MTSSTSIQQNPYYRLFENQQNHRQKVSRRTVRKRLYVLKALEKTLHRYRKDFQEALYKDFRKTTTETDLTELYPLLSEIRHVRANLRNWLRDEVIENGLAFWGTKGTITRAAKGVCLIISPWNYPLVLTLGPLISAIAAGNTAIIKPSEFTPHTSAMLKKVIEELFPPEEVIVIEGKVEVAEQLLALPFDHIHFTGSTPVGKKVMESASSHLTSVTLELGGKSPVYIHSDANIKDAAAKITAAKLVNAGQTCIAPDYILVHHDLKESLIAALKKSFKTFYDPERKEEASNYTGIINTKHYERLENLHPGNKQLEDLKQKLLFEPVIIEEAGLNEPVMKEELFGPVLPVISVINEEEAIKIIHQLPEPLCIYVFSANHRITEHFRTSTRSGSICYNECAVHFLHPGLPFGGIRQSGLGRAHGKAGVLSFTDERVVFKQRIGITMAKLLYPPYNPLKKKVIDWLLKYF